MLSVGANNLKQAFSFRVNERVSLISCHSLQLSAIAKFSELRIDTSKININKCDQWFSWNYRSNDSTSSLNEKMENFPAFLLDGDLNLITSDNQLVILDIESSNLSNVQNAENYFFW